MYVYVAKRGEVGRLVKMSPGTKATLSLGDGEIEVYGPILAIPNLEQLWEWEADAGCEALDGCWVELDGYCPHGLPAWTLVMGVV